MDFSTKQLFGGMPLLENVGTVLYNKVFKVFSPLFLVFCRFSPPGTPSHTAVNNHRPELVDQVLAGLLLGVAKGSGYRWSGSLLFWCQAATKMLGAWDFLQERLHSPIKFPLVRLSMATNELNMLEWS